MTDELETVVPYRHNPREFLDVVVDDIEFVDRGEWKVTATDAVYRDVMVGGLYMEGYRIGAIEHIDGSTFTFEVIENYDLEDKRQYLGDTDSRDEAAYSTGQRSGKGPAILGRLIRWWKRK